MTDSVRGWALAISLVAGFSAACGGGATKEPQTANSAREDDPGLRDYIVSKGGVGPYTNGEGSAAPAPDAFRLELLDKDRPIKFDGVVQEWPARFPVKQPIQGVSKASLSVSVQYDDAKVYVGGEVSDETFVRTARFGDAEDHASLILSIPSASGASVAYEVGFYAGKPGDSAGSVRYLSGGHKGQVVPDSKIVEAPIAGGYSFEAAFPWAALPEAVRVRVGMHGAARYYDVDAPGGAAAIVATGPGDASSPAALPPLPTESEQSLVEQLLAPKNLVGQAPKFDRIADIAGDAMRERIAVFGNYLVVCGSNYLGGARFFYRDIGADFVSVELRDATGRGKSDILVRRRSTENGATRELFEVLSAFGANDEPSTVFAHEIAIASGAKRITNSVHVAPREIDVAIDTATGWDASTYNEPVASDVEPILLPWGGVRSQTFKFAGQRFTKGKEVSQTPQGPTTPAGSPSPSPSVRPPEPPTPTVRPAGDLAQQLFEQYRKDRNVPADLKPKVDLQVNVSGDPRPERVVLIGKDIVVLSPGAKSAAAYTFLTISDAAEVREMAARDLTGDGSAELTVRATLRRTASASPEPVEVDVLFIYQVKNDGIARVFAIETGREQAKKRVQGLVQFIPSSSGKTFDIDVQPGRATGWTEKSYPWSQDQPASGALEPLLLPWGGIPHLRYGWNGTQFVKQ